MKKLFAILAVSCLLLCTTGCDEQKTINAIKTGQTMAATLAGSTYTAFTLAHQSGKITDEQWNKFLGVWEKYKTANQLMIDGIEAWEKGVDKPTIERLQILLANLNQIIEDVNALIDAWNLRTVEMPKVGVKK